MQHFASGGGRGWCLRGQVALEAEAKAAAEAERALVQRALEAERRSAELARAEAAAAAEAADAERAAKFAADSEARELQRELDGLTAALLQQRYNTMSFEKSCGTQNP